MTGWLDALQGSLEENGDMQPGWIKEVIKTRLKDELLEKRRPFDGRTGWTG